MKLTTLLVLFVCTFLVMLCISADGCNNCGGAYDSCCNDFNNNNGKPTCYDTRTHQCNDNCRLCPKNHLSCGRDCYDPAHYHCCHNQKLIPIEENKCSKDKCGKLSCCPTEHGDERCYNPNYQQCTEKGLVWRCYNHWGYEDHVCSGHGDCIGKDKCKCDYGYSGKKCERKTHPKCNCKKEEKCCYDDRKGGKPYCYNPKTHHCVNKKYLCKKGEKNCGKDCYDPKKHKCVKGKVQKRE